MGLYQTQKFCITKETINKIKWQNIEWGKKIFANHITDKRLISKIYKELIKLNNNKRSNKLINFKNGQSN